jgi:DNA polymerase III delta prime subunit
VVDAEVIAEVVSKMTGIPLTRMTTEDSMRLMQMEEELHKRSSARNEAIKAIAKAVRRSRSGLKDPKRPTGCFLFAGPTGVGKTLLAKALAEFMFGDQDALIQIDMSEYMEKHNVSRSDRCSSGIRRLRRRRSADREDSPSSVRGGAARRNREGSSGRLQHAAADHGRRPFDRQLRSQRRLPQRDSDHDHQRRAPKRSRTNRRSASRSRDEDASYEG